MKSRLLYILCCIIYLKSFYHQYHYILTSIFIVFPSYVSCISRAPFVLKLLDINSNYSGAGVAPSTILNSFEAKYILT